MIIVVKFFEVSGFISQLVRASHRYREDTGSNPVEVLTFSGSYTHCLNCVHNCDNCCVFYNVNLVLSETHGLRAGRQCFRCLFLVAFQKGNYLSDSGQCNLILH